MIIETDRLLMQTGCASAVTPILDYYVRNKAFHEEWAPRRERTFYTLQYQKEQMEREEAQTRNGRLIRFWLAKKDDPGRQIGLVSFSNIIRGAFLSCFLGYHLDQSLINQGYMTEAIRAGIGYVFEKAGLHRIEANIMPRNKASLRVVEKLEFYEEGIARNYLKIYGNWEDHIHMVLLNENA